MLGLAQIGSSPKMAPIIKWIRANPFFGSVAELAKAPTC